MIYKLVRKNPLSVNQRLQTEQHYYNRSLLNFKRGLKLIKFTMSAKLF